MGTPESFDSNFDDDFDTASFYGPPTRPVARKQHGCIGCGGLIVIGERYVQQASASEDGWYHNRFHQECWDSLSKRGNSFSFGPGELEPPERLRNNEQRI
jgi:hypothetical protein